MYVETLALANLRTFVRNELEFVHPDKAYRPRHPKTEAEEKLLPKPRLPNVNLLLGDNGSGKSTILRAIAQAALGPAARDASLGDNAQIRWGEQKAIVDAGLLLHAQDQAAGRMLKSRTVFTREGELELGEFTEPDKDAWKLVYSSKNDAFFVVGYGATRRVERAENVDVGARTKKSFARAQRVQSLFEDFFSLIPLSYWLPREKTHNPGRYKQVVTLLNRLLKPGNYVFTEEQNDGGDYLFSRGGMPIPFQHLSDGYRAFIGWVADLLYHVCFGAPSGKMLIDGCGIVMVDEIDLHLHPKWQMQVIGTVAKALPKMQFIFTSHSPLVAGSLEWMNIITLKAGEKSNRTTVKRLEESIHGLDADQLLVSGLFGLKTTRSRAKSSELNRLTLLARDGNEQAAKALVESLARGMEETR
ncbi:AAA family ATPase [Planctellipticum variicoloris]|uniref:AAA family ATPase n=1 Tax=Planctellipticum variicoloris TaxID=3064265 RepID=UPI003013FE87|nr:AAA family ATPase [Planctomycetaceae bacterium SH412]